MNKTEIKTKIKIRTRSVACTCRDFQKLPTILKIAKIPEILELSLGEVIVANPLTDHAWARTPPFPFPTHIYIFFYLYM